MSLVIGWCEARASFHCFIWLTPKSTSQRRQISFRLLLLALPLRNEEHTQMFSQKIFYKHFIYQTWHFNTQWFIFCHILGARVWNLIFFGWYNCWIFGDIIAIENIIFSPFVSCFIQKKISLLYLWNWKDCPRLDKNCFISKVSFWCCAYFLPFSVVASYWLIDWANKFSLQFVFAPKNTPFHLLWWFIYYCGLLRATTKQSLFILFWQFLFSYTDWSRIFSPLILFWWFLFT